MPIFCVGILAGQTGADATVSIQVPDSISAVWGRYVTADNQSRKAGWTGSRNEQGDYLIKGIQASRETRFRAIVFVQGCSLRTLDIAITESRNYRYAFVCESLPQKEIQGTIGQSGSYGQEITLEAKYIASWAPAFFAYDDGTTTEIPLGSKVNIVAQNKFVLPIPDLSKDKIAGSASYPGEIRIFVRENASGRIIDQLRVLSNNQAVRATRFGGIPIAALSVEHPVFTFCETSSAYSHDKYGFAHRENIAEEVCHPQ